jgi:hypothetical protein
MRKFVLEFWQLRGNKELFLHELVLNFIYLGNIIIALK